MTSSWRANSLGSRFWIQKDLGEYSPGSNIKFYFRIKKIYIIQVQDEEEEFQLTKVNVSLESRMNPQKQKTQNL